MLLTEPIGIIYFGNSFLLSVEEYSLFCYSTPIGRRIGWLVHDYIPSFGSLKSNDYILLVLQGCHWL